MSVTFFPYKSLTDEIELELDFGNVPHTIMGPGQVGLFEPPLTSAVSIAILATLPPKWKDEVSSKKELGSQPYEVVLLVGSVESRVRERIKLKAGSAGKFRGTLMLDPTVHTGEIGLRACVVRGSNAKQPVAGFAADKGSQVARSAEQLVHLTKPQPRPGNHLNVQWKSFSASNEFLADFDQAFLSFEEDDDPTLYLNQDSTGSLRALIDYAGNGNAKARARDALFAAIQLSVWQTLLTSSLLRLYQVALEDSSEADLKSLKPWGAGVIKEAAPVLYPEVSADKAVDHLLEKVVDLSSLTDLISRRVPAAAQQFAKLREVFEVVSEDHQHV